MSGMEKGDRLGQVDRNSSGGLIAVEQLRTSVEGFDWLRHPPLFRRSMATGLRRDLSNPLRSQGPVGGDEEPRKGDGAGERDRTVVLSLGSSRSTIELRPRSIDFTTFPSASEPRKGSSSGRIRNAVPCRTGE